MAYIRINEIDRSIYYNRVLTNDNVVLVGGSHNSGGTAPSGQLTLCTSLRDFYEYFGSTPVSNDWLGWEYAANIIRAGFPVMYYSYYKQGVDTATDVGTMTGADKIARIYNDYNTELLQDKINYNVKFFPTVYRVSNDYDEPNSDYNGSIKKILSLVSDEADLGYSGRGDGLILVDFTEGQANAKTWNTSEGTFENNQWYIPTMANAAGIRDSSYLVVPGPAAYLQSPITGERRLMPPSFWILKTMAEAVTNGIPVYSTFAGTKRGLISDIDGFSSKVSYQTMRDWTEVEKVIPLMNMPSYGDVIFGNSTRLHVYTSDEAANNSSNPHSALDSLNVRITANEIKRAIFNICLGLSFDSNDYILWTEFRTKLSNVLDKMKAGRAVNDYKITMDSTTVTNEAIDDLRVPGRVQVDISRAAERFVINFELTRTGALTSETEVLETI